MDPVDQNECHETVVVELHTLEELASKVTEHICKLNKKVLGEEKTKELNDQSIQLIADGDLFGFVQLLLKHIKVALNDEKTAENNFNLVFTFIRHLNQEQTEECVPFLCSMLTNNFTDMVDVRFTILTNLYNVLLPSSHSRYTVFLEIIHYATDTKQAKSLRNDIDNLQRLVKQWNITIEEERDLYISLCNAYETIDERNADSPDPASSTPTGTAPNDSDSGLMDYTKIVQASQQLLLAHLYTFENCENNDELENVSDIAVRAALGFIKSPITLSGSLSLTNTPPILHLKPIVYLKTSPQYSLLYELLYIFCSSGLNEYTNFITKNPKFVASQGLSEDKCMENMRLLTLASLASNNDKVTYERICSELHVEPDTVEPWIVKAMSNGLIDAKMDQLNQVVVMNKGSQRVFTDDDWSQLSSKLNTWRTSVRNLLQTVKAAKLQHDSIKA